MFVDSHCHLEMEEYDKDRGAVIDRALADRITYMVTVGTDPTYFPKVVQMIDRYPQVYGAIGIHPHNASAYSADVEKAVREHLKHPKIVAYGEIGLDFFRNHSPHDVQIRVFRRQIELGCEAHLPIVIHSRDARDETLTIIREMRLFEHPTVIHCYSYDLDTAKELLDMGMYLSVPGTVTYKNSLLPGIVAHAPLDRLLSETDAPFLTPTPHRGKRNEPAMVRLVAEEIARIRQQSVDEVASTLMATFKNLFVNGRKGL
jgi:TatD DNase family protein